eukprot:6481096-Amphidinium_carterae.2
MKISCGIRAALHCSLPLVSLHPSDLLTRKQSKKKTFFQSLTSTLGWHSSKTRTTAKNSARCTDWLIPGSGKHALSWVSV